MENKSCQITNGIEKLKELTRKLPAIVDRLDVPVRILLVENNVRTRILILQSLEYFGGSCIVADNGKEAMDILATGEFDVLLGHILMKEEIGIGVLRTFQEKNPKSMIVIVSGSDDNLKEYGKYLSILALPFGFYDLLKTAVVNVEVTDK